MTLYGLVQRFRVGDKVQVTSSRANVERQSPKTVKRIEAETGKILVEADGPQGGQNAFWVDVEGNSEMVFIDSDGDEQSQGPVELARLVWPGDRPIST